MLTATTVTPLAFMRLCICTNDGISSTQGGHHVAQKFSTTICPRNWFSVTVRSESCTVKAGAFDPMRGGRDPL
jgi:hypothetical protein